MTEREYFVARTGAVDDTTKQVQIPNRVTANIAQKMVPLPAPESVKRRWGVVETINPGPTLDVRIGGILVQYLQFASSYIPQINDRVYIDIVGTDLIVAGTTARAGQATTIVTSVNGQVGDVGVDKIGVVAPTAGTIPLRDEGGRLEVATPVDANDAVPLAHFNHYGHNAAGLARGAVITGSTTLTDADIFNTVVFSPTAAATLTIPAEATLPVAIGSWFDVMTTFASGPISVVGASGVTVVPYVVGYPHTSVDSYAIARFLKISSTQWINIFGYDTGPQAPAASGTWSSYVFQWRVKNGICSYSFVGVPASGTTSAASVIFTFPQGARPAVTQYVNSVYADVSKEVNIGGYNDGTTANRGRVTVNKALSSGQGIAISGAFTCVRP